MATKIGDININKISNKLQLNTKETYVADDVFFNVSVILGSTAAGTASADVSAISGQSSSGGTNIKDSIGERSSVEPSSGYYIRMLATGSGNSKVTNAGWLPASSLETASKTTTRYFPIDAGTASIGGTNIVTPSASVSGTNITLSNTDNGISVVATGGGTASASVNATTTQAGYVPNNSTLDTQTIAAGSQTTTASTFISGVTLTAPPSGSQARTFSITVPNGNTTATFVFNVDSSGNVTITES